MLFEVVCDVRYYSLSRLFISPYIFIFKAEKELNIKLTHKRSRNNDESYTPLLDDDHLHYS